jgi:cysteine synthase A
MIDRSTTLLPDITAAIGATPLVELTRLTENLNGRILAKLDYLNPGFSKKDRAALQIILDAESAGQLAPGQTVIELTSGNMGTGLAIVCTVRGYPFIAVMSRGNSMERARMMKALGAEVVLVDQCPDSVPGQVSGADLQRVEEVTERLVGERQAFRADQFLLPGNRRAHYLGTGPELVAQSADTIDGFCDFVGSGGTLAGVTQYLKEHNRAIRCYGVEPTGAEALAGGCTNTPGHRIQGGGYLMADLQALADVELDGYLRVSDADAIHYARELAAREGIFAGYSAGANVAAAIQLLRTGMAGKTIAVVMCDSGLKYLSTDLWA